MAWSSTPKLSHLKYSTVTGYFEQDDPNTESHRYDYVCSRFIRYFLGTDNVQTPYFGLIDRAYDSDAEFDPHREKSRWQRFHYHVEKLNERTGSSTEYKVLYCLSPSLIHPSSY